MGLWFRSHCTLFQSLYSFNAKKSKLGKILSTKNVSRNICCPCSHSLLHGSNPFPPEKSWLISANNLCCEKGHRTRSNLVSPLSWDHPQEKKSQLFKGWQSRSGGSTWPGGIYCPKLTLPDCRWLILAAAPDAGEDVPVPQLQELTAQCLPFNSSPGFGAAPGTSGATRMQAKAPTGAWSWGWGAITPYCAVARLARAHLSAR